MTLFRWPRALKSGIAVLVSGSLFVTSVALPAAAQTYRGRFPTNFGSGTSSPYGSVAVAGGGVPGEGRLPVLPGALIASANMVPTFSAPTAPTSLSAPAAATGGERPASALVAMPAAQDEKAVPPNRGDFGPRWVKTEEPQAVRSISAPKVAGGGPRWVGSQKGRLRAALAKLLPFLADRSGKETFDGAASRASSTLAEPTSFLSVPPRAGLSKFDRAIGRGSAASIRRGEAAERAGIIQDLRIPTPEAVARTARLEKKAGLARLKTLAPAAVLGAAAAIFPANIVPAAIISAALMFSILAHESAHILGLRIWGDKTPKLAGRDSLNPFDHISMLGTVLVPSVSLLVSMSTIGFPLLLGWAKPVPADFNNLKNPKTDAAKVAILGPLTNLALAAVAGAVYLAFPAAGIASTIALTLFKMNAALTVFNLLLPLPMLDGGKVLISLLPKSLYARWTHDPNLPLGYQSLYKRIYEGPANLLSKLRIRSFERVNTLTRVASLAALGAFYAAFFTTLAVPLLFLALPCSYDYWCIREKVRSEAAVKDLMEIMGQWSAVIVQIAEDMGLESEVSAYETEHAMKNALEALIDAMMAKEEFRALSDEQKLDALMKAYPDKAASYLKDKAMPEDSLEKIAAVLSDTRNGPFYERLKKWFSDSEIFARWGKPHDKEKLKDALKDADKPKERAAGGPGGGFAANILGPGGAALSAIAAVGLGAGMGMFPDWAAPISQILAGLGVFAMMGTVFGGSGAPDDPMRKVTADTDAAPNVIVVHTLPNANKADIARVFAGLEHWYWRSAPATAPHIYSVSVVVADSDYAVLARRIAHDPAVTAVSVPPSVYEHMALSAAEPVIPSADGRGNWQAKIARSGGSPEGRVRAVFARVSGDGVRGRLSGYRIERKLSDGIYDIAASNAEAAAEIARDLAGDETISRVEVSPAVYARLLGLPAAAAEPPAETNGEKTPPAEAPAAKPALPAKVASHGKAEYGVNVVLVKFMEGAEQTTISEVMARHGQAALYRHGDMLTLSAQSAQSAREKAAALAVEESVAEVSVHPNVAAAMTEDQEPYPHAPSYDHERAVIVEFRAGTAAEAIANYAEVRRLILVHPNFRGAERSALLAVPQDADLRATLQMLVDETAAASSPAESVRPFQEQPGEPALTPQPAAAAVEEAQAPEAAALRRDPAQAWHEYLQNITLNDGKSKLTDKQVQLMSTLLKPLARAPDAPRPPIVARNDEVKRILPIVTSARGMRNSVILIGEAGVGKTAVAEGLAEMIEDAEHAAASDSEAFLQFQRLKGRWLVELDINKILTTDDPVGLLSAILDLLPRLNSAGPSRGNDVIVLMDEIQKFFLDNAGQKIANTLKGPLRDGKISVIATTTRSEYRKFIESDDAFRRRFEKIDIEEPTVESTIAILRAMKSWLSALHEAVIPDSALVSAAKLTDQFDKTNFNPDKAIKAVQDAAEMSRPDNLRAAVTLDLRETWGRLVVAANEARVALVDKGIASILALPVDLYNTIAGLVARAEALYAEREAVADGAGQVTIEVVKRVIAAKTGIASGQLNLGEEDAARYVKMEAEIGARVINQERALTAIANAVRRNKAGLSNPNRPMGKFLLTGPTGVGKTYLAKELARFLFKDPEAMTRLDMSEYMEEHTALRLTGAPPSYVGYEAGGQLTEAVRRKPYSVILFDEIEKAHPKVFDVLLQILDDGRLTDGQGRTVDFKNTVIIMTSNAGMASVGGEKYASLLAKVEDHNERAKINAAWDEEIDLMIAEAVKARFRPEFLNRLDEDSLSKNKWIRVNRLRPEDIAKIARLQLAEFASLLADRHDTDIYFDESVVAYLGVEGYSPLYGARPMTAAIEKHIIDPLARWILKEAESGKKDVRGGRIVVAYAGGKITFEASVKPEKNVKRETVSGASEAVAASVFKLIEGWAASSEGEEPSEDLFDRFMRKARPAVAEKTSTVERARVFFAPQAALEVKGTPVALEHNAAKKKDAQARLAIKAVRESAGGKGWGAPALDVLDAEPGRIGEGWIKQIVKFAKEQATKAGVSEPIAIAAQIEEGAIRIAVRGSYALTAEVQKALIAHFSGTPPRTYLEAQQKADNLNLTASMVWDHNLLDLYRRLAALPGARMGFTTGESGAQIWLEIVNPPVSSPVAVAPKPAAVALGERPVTPHQAREMAKTRDLLMRVIDQSQLKEHERDGHAIRIAAAEGYARLAPPSDAALVREWIETKGWGATVVDEETGRYSSSSPKVQVGADWPLAMTAALILERFGGEQDVERLENMARRVMGTGHDEVPVHNALVAALASIYARLGLEATRKAAVRAAQIGGGRTTDITDAVKRALGVVGMPADIDLAKLDADGYLAMMKRLGRQDELLRVFRDNAVWAMQAQNETARQAALKLAGETETGDDALNRLKNMMRTQTSHSRTGYEMSRSWAAIVAREGRTQGLGDAIKRYLDARGVTNHQLASSWPILLAYVEAARLAGGADALEPLEELMGQPPGNMASLNEQAYFTAPDAWARTLTRNGKFEEYSRSRGLDADGAPKPSKLQEMLTSKERPMLAAAALRAIAYARDPARASRIVEPKGPVPDIHPEPGSSSSSSSSWASARGSAPRFEYDVRANDL